MWKRRHRLKGIRRFKDWIVSIFNKIRSCEFSSRSCFSIVKILPNPATFHEFFVSRCCLRFRLDKGLFFNASGTLAYD